MSVLDGQAIWARLKEHDLAKRLVVSPLLDPQGQVRPGQASVDVRLGFEFALVTASATGVVDEFAEASRQLSQLSFSSLYRKEYVPLGASIVIHPHQFILATTLEYIRLPSDLMAYVVGRSTWGRLGLINATAVGIHPGFAGSLTLELRNLGETPLALYPGQTIGQLFFHRVEGGDPQVAVTGQYGGTVDMVPQRISSPKTAERLRALSRQFNGITNI
ncbi:dCTP deaminase [Nitrospirillum amazonense]|uniref:dCTP deaminase n=1 Tax=Nitrospirillum amazonense TaxID=28077 RepID=A0A560EUA0_9PROT|nr:dCTP deaminase [Nitrospirillum amazonense]TWB12959.1 dCTP deaminase [Nitrospirillum amazonense]